MLETRVEKGAVIKGAGDVRGECGEYLSGNYC